MLYKFCDVTDVVAMTRIAGDYKNYHNQIDVQIIPLATKQIQNLCRRSFIEAQYTEYHPTVERLNSSTKLWLKEINLSDVVVKVDYNWPRDWSTVDALQADEYLVDADKGTVELLIDTREHARSIQVVYTGGYEVQSAASRGQAESALVAVPDDLRHACALQSAFMLDRIVNKDTGQSGKKGPSVIPLKLQSQAANGVIPEAISCIAHYRRMLTGKVSYGPPVYL